MTDIMLTLGVIACLAIVVWRMAHAQGRKKWFVILAIVLSVSLSISHRQPKSACQRNLAAYLQTHTEIMDNNYVSYQLGVCSQ